ncbi:ATP-dependent protease ATPase subunit HslU [Striga asiatica]|uniref:ATP-dependent protease ATPase subunit HslU n=1 Tax=Striga asiatica TaxID=4170 RepID=A0A5A7PNL5_STRAF|nr:ATP-dependent protease ATPase subunit HslU [Striga asiatica]
MIAVREDNRYTSLKDLLPDSPPAAAISRGDSWREIQIKDPLLQHAAWAYLQPMAVERGGRERWWSGFVGKCCGLLGCLNDIVMVVFGFGAWELAVDDKI